MALQIWPWNRLSYFLLLAPTQSCIWTIQPKEGAGCTCVKGERTGISWSRRQKPSRVWLSLANLISLIYHSSSLISGLVPYSTMRMQSEATSYISLQPGYTKLRLMRSLSASEAMSSSKQLFMKPQLSLPTLSIWRGLKGYTITSFGGELMQRKMTNSQLRSPWMTKTDL